MSRVARRAKERITATAGYYRETIVTARGPDGPCTGIPRRASQCFTTASPKGVRLRAHGYVKRCLEQAVERRGLFSAAIGHHTRNYDRPLPCVVPNHGATVRVPLFIYRDLAAEAGTLREIELRVVLWSALLTDTVEVRLNDQALGAGGARYWCLTPGRST